MQKVGLATVLMAGMLIGTAVYAQNPPPAQEPGGARQQSGEMTLTGCLSSGTGNTFVLKTKDQGEVTVTGSNDLSKHSGHTVTLTGSMKQEQGKSTMQVSQLKHVSNTCSN
jgi:hypothetical protein